MASLTGGETIVLTTAPHPSDQQGLTKKEEEHDEKVLENLKKELKEKQREAYIVQRDVQKTEFEWNKLHFRQTMEKAWFTNAIIKERCLVSHETKTIDESGRHQLRKALDFNMKIKYAIIVGLDGALFGRASKRKRSSSYVPTAKELKESEQILLQIVPHDLEKVRQKTYLPAHPFAKLESREECLESVIKSLLEREAREIVFRPTENELLGYMLLKEIADTTLRFPHVYFPPDTVLEIEPLNERISVGIFADDSDCQALFAKYDAMLKEADKSEEMELIKEFMGLVENVIKEGKRDIIETRRSQLAAQRSFEIKLVKHCEELVDMRRARRRDQFSPTETNRLEEIFLLADKAIQKHTQAKGPDSLPQITEPVCPRYPPPSSD